MADVWAAKAPAEIVERRWTAPACDGIASVVAIGTGVTVDSEDYDTTDAIVTLSGGTAGATSSVVVTVTANDGQTFENTFLIAVRAGAAQLSNTVRDVCGFALRKIAGNGNDADSAELDDAVERLNDMVALWRIDGLDIGLPLPLVASDTLSLPDEYVAALKFNLRISCHDHYDAPLTALDTDMAVQSKRLIANRLLDIRDLTMPRGLSTTRDSVADLF